MLPKSVFWILSLSALALLFLCDCTLPPKVPESPEVIQYGIFADIDPPGFHGVNSKTGDLAYKPFADEEMKAGQCLSADDYKKSEAWVAAIKELAQKMRP